MPETTGKATHVSDEELVWQHVGLRQTASQIARELGVSRQWILRRLRRAGVPPEETHRVQTESRHRRVTWTCLCGEILHLPPAQARRRKLCSPTCPKRATWQREQLLSHLKGLSQELGRTPTAHHLLVWDGPGPTPYYREFGSLRVAQEEAGLVPNRRNGDGQE